MSIKVDIVVYETGKDPQAYRVSYNVDHNVYWQKFHTMTNILQYLPLQALQYLTVFLMATNKFCNFSTTIPWYTALLQ